MTKTELYQELFRQYQNEHDHKISGTREVVDWAVENGLLPVPQIDPLDISAGEMSRALREECATDAKGRRYRVNQAVRYTKKGAQVTMWGIEGFVDPSHSIMSFAQRREQIIGDCLQLKTDVDVHNDKHSDIGQQYELDLDFTQDVAEREVSHYESAA